MRSSEPGLETSDVVEAVLRLLWRQWTALGVAGDSGAAVSAPDDAESSALALIDPEALLVATLQLGRRDPRLFDEALDWCARNGVWLSLQRLKTLARTASAASCASQHNVLLPTLTAVAAVLDGRDTRGRWRSLTRLAPPVGAPVPLFREIDGTVLPLFGAMDPEFARAGLARDPVQLRGLSGPVPMTPPACLRLRLRTLLGIGPRADCCAYLLTKGNLSGGVSAREIARAISCSAPAAYEALGALSSGGFLVGAGKGLVAVDRERWRRFLDNGSDPPNSLPHWVDWPVVYRALVIIIEDVGPALASVADAKTSSYLRASRLLRLHDLLRTWLAPDAGLGDTVARRAFAVPATLESAESALMQGIAEFLRGLLSFHM